MSRTRESRRHRPSRVRRGLLAGAVGSLALEVTAYGDMLVRGRAPSELPEHSAALVADSLGLDLDRGSEDAGKNRRVALGAILGHATGVIAGVVATVALPRRAGTRTRVVVLGGTALALGTIPVWRAGLTDPREWGPSGWLADIVPHLAYGFAAASVLEALTPRD
jgi:hypothetical protein